MPGCIANDAFERRAWRQNFDAAKFGFQKDAHQRGFLPRVLGDSRLDSQRVRLELAVSMFDRELVSIGVAARIAGSTIGEMIDELGRRRISVTRYSQEEFAEEMKHVRGLAGRR